MSIQEITESELSELGVCSMPTRPNAAREFGGRGYTPTQLKAAFDRLPRLIAARYNELIRQIEEGDLGDAMLVDYGGSAMTLKEAMDAIFTGKETLAEELTSKVDASLSEMEKAVEGKVDRADVAQELDMDTPDHNSAEHPASASAVVSCIRAAEKKVTDLVERLRISLDSSDYTIALLDADGTPLGDPIDLPLESVVVNGNFDGDSGNIVLTLENGNTIQVPVGDLVRGLATTEEVANLSEKVETDYVSKSSVDALPTAGSTNPVSSGGVQEALNSLWSAIGRSGDSVKSWSGVQAMVRRNTHTSILSVADQFETERDGEALTFDVLDFDKHTPADRSLAHSVALGLHDVLTYGTIPFCAPQLLYYTEGGLPAGSYRFTLDHAAYGGSTACDGTYLFTLTEAIPADGGFRHTNIGGYKASYAQSDVIGNRITTYGERPGRAVIERGIAVSIWDGTTACTDLGTFTSRSTDYHTAVDEANGGQRNFTERTAYGSNRWRDSAYRQWLNSDADAVPASDTATVSNWWKPATVFDTVPGGAKLAGFLHGLDPEFVAVLGEVEVTTALCDCDKVDGATYDITYDKVWLQSKTEVFGGNNTGVTEGTHLAYWVDAKNAGRIKYEGTTARAWWLRSPYTSHINTVYSVEASGALNSYATASLTTGGIVPACCIV